MVDEIQKELEEGTEKLVNAITRALQAAAQKETDPMRRKLMEEVADLPSSERCTITYHPELAGKVDDYCMKHKIPHSTYMAGQARNLGESGVWIPKVYEDDVLKFIQSLEHNNPRYYRDSDSYNYLWNLEQTGSRDVLRMDFNTKEEAELFRNKLFQNGTGSSCTITKDPGGFGYILYIGRHSMVQRDPNKMDWMQAAMENALNRADPFGNFIKKAQIRWDEKEEDKFADNVLTSMERTNAPVYLVNPDDPQVKLVYRPGKGILLEDAYKGERDRVLITMKDLSSMKDVDRTTAIDSIRRAAGAGFDKVHNMQAMTMEEYELFKRKPKRERVESSELNTVLQYFQKENKSDHSELNPEELLDSLKLRPEIDMEKLSKRVDAAMQRGTTVDPILQRMAASKKLRDELSDVCSQWMTEHCPNLSAMTTAELTAAIRECWTSDAVDKVLAPYKDKSPDLYWDIRRNLEDELNRTKVSPIRECEKEAKEGDRAYEKYRAEEKEKEEKQKSGGSGNYGMGEKEPESSTRTEEAEEDNKKPNTDLW